MLSRYSRTKMAAKKKQKEVTLAEKVLVLLQGPKISQAELAKTFDVSQPVISRLVKKENYIPVYMGAHFQSKSETEMAGICGSQILVVKNIVTLSEACLSNNKVAKVGEIKGIIGETQKRALNKPGGNRYKSRDRKVVGDLEGARHYGSTARCLNVTALVLTILTFLIIIILLAVGVLQIYSSAMQEAQNQHNLFQGNGN
ncbi:Interferon-induced transmembrane protein 1 [Acipenser ruthenus]|uniref:Interferon-induced transmembrane protein 1 n=1 Tax=Acipenser ruthenus TaxID=7906 RepID=A0A444UKC0_ACIRT|nr:Interferon-induced transmembrane protein 1 [Acipenser ruthenus]